MARLLPHCSMVRGGRRPKGPRRRVRLGVLCALLPPLLGACASREAPPPCPRVIGVPEAQNVARFIEDGRDLTDVLFEARFQDAVLECEYDDGVVEANMRVTIVATRGPADFERKATLAYFVAVATRDNQVLAREEFDLEIPFPGNRTRMAAVEEIAQRIPLKPGENGADYVIYVGLALTPQELDYNLTNR